MTTHSSAAGPLAFSPPRPLRCGAPLCPRLTSTPRDGTAAGLRPDAQRFSPPCGLRFSCSLYLSLAGTRHWPPGRHRLWERVADRAHGDALMGEPLFRTPLTVLMLGTLVELSFVGVVAGMGARSVFGGNSRRLFAWLGCALVYVACHVFVDRVFTSRAVTGAVLSGSSPHLRHAALQRIARDRDRSYRGVLLTALEKGSSSMSMRTSSGHSRGSKMAASGTTMPPLLEDRAGG